MPASGPAFGLSQTQETVKMRQAFTNLCPKSKASEAG